MDRWMVGWFMVVAALAPSFARAAGEDGGFAETSTSAATSSTAAPLAGPGDAPGAPRLAPVPTLTPTPAAPVFVPPAAPARVAPAAPERPPPPEYPLEATLRPLVLPPGMIALRAASTSQFVGDVYTRTQLVPSVGVGLGGGWDLTLAGPGVSWVDFSAELGDLSEYEAPEPVQPTLSADHQLHRDAVEVVAGATVLLPLFAPRIAAGSLGVRMKTCGSDWLAFSTGASVLLYARPGELEEGLVFAVSLPATLVMQAADRFALVLGTGLDFVQTPLPPGGSRESEVLVSVPLLLGAEVSLGGDHAWGEIGLSLTLPRVLGSSIPMGLAAEKGRIGTWVGVFL